MRQDCGKARRHELARARVLAKVPCRASELSPIERSELLPMEQAELIRYLPDSGNTGCWVKR